MEIRTKNKRTWRTLLAVFMAFLVTFISIPVPAGAAAKYNVTVTLLKKQLKKTVTIQKGAKIQIEGYDGKQISAKKLKFSSNKSDIAKVNSKGEISTKKTGTAVITITTKDGKKKAKLTVKIVNKKVPLKKVTLDKKSLNLKVGDKAKLKVSFSPETASDQKARWTSSNETIASVSGGTVTAVGPGAATITVKASDRFAYCTVTVEGDAKPSDDENDSIKVTGITLSPSSATINVNGTVSVIPTIAPSDATNKSVSYSTSNAGIATVTSGGIIRGVKAGSAVITCTANDGSGVSATCEITVTEGTLFKSGIYGSTTWSLYKTSDTPKAYTLICSGSGELGIVLHIHPMDHHGIAMKAVLQKSLSKEV